MTLLKPDTLVGVSLSAAWAWKHLAIGNNRACVH